MDSLITPDPGASALRSPTPLVLPTMDDIRARLSRVQRAGRLSELADTAGVPRSALDKIRNGDVANPGILTVAKFWGDLVGMCHALDAFDRLRPASRAAADDPNAAGPPSSLMTS